MVSDIPEEMPLACSLPAEELRARSDENTSRFGRAQQVQELADGYTFAFPAGEARDLLEFVLAERSCCPFFTFELLFPSPHQVIYLTVRGASGVKEMVAEMASAVSPGLATAVARTRNP